VKIIVNGNPTHEQKDLINFIAANFEGKSGNVEILLQNERESVKPDVERESGRN